jgi:energy-coupling factor transporter ATP-binding protein EcfA2
VLFFGREKQVDELMKKLRMVKFLAVIGSSGSGKSSLVKSGLIPSLHSGFMAGAGSNWKICTFIPAIILLAIYQALAQPNILYPNFESDEDAFTYTSINESTLRRSQDW